MASNTTTTATVRLQLDLSGLIAQLRELADTLEATQQPKRYDDIPAVAMDDPFGLAAANLEAAADFPPTVPPAGFARIVLGAPGDFPCCAPGAEAEAVNDPEPDRPTACESCNTTWDDCDEKLATKGRACCKPCKVYDTHKADEWELWRARESDRASDAHRATPTPLDAAEQCDHDQAARERLANTHLEDTQP